VLKLERVADNFEAQYDCLYRRYVYKMRFYRTDLSGSSLDRFRVLPLFRVLNVAAMQEAARMFEGQHDFAALATQESRSTERTVYVTKLIQEDRDLSLHISANGFLRNMVRAVVGTLLLVGEGKLDPQDIPLILASKDRNRAGDTVPPQGLYFVEAGYTPWCT
jgi:tRNA pseudouridine38-40 synthase